MDHIMTTESHDGILVLRLHGELDIDLEDALRRHLAVLPQDGATAIVADLADVTFLDCVCLNLLLALARRCARAGVGFLLIGVNGLVRRVIEVLGLTPALTGVADEPTAMVLATVWQGGPPADLPSPLLPQPAPPPRWGSPRWGSPRPGITGPADRGRPGVG